MRLWGNDTGCTGTSGEKRGNVPGFSGDGSQKSLGTVLEDCKAILKNRPQAFLRTVPENHANTSDAGATRTSVQGEERASWAFSQKRESSSALISG